MNTPAAWWRKCKRRRPGIYLVRTDRHLKPGRRENGYVGESVHVEMRGLDHLGRGRYGHAAKDWADLRTRWHVLRLPWWLGWKWVLRPLETLAILLTWPRYNDAKNRWNPRRIPRHVQALQRRNRDRLLSDPGLWIRTTTALHRAAHTARRVAIGSAVAVVAVAALALTEPWR